MISFPTNVAKPSQQTAGSVVNFQFQCMRLGFELEKRQLVVNVDGAFNQMPSFTSLLLNQYNNKKTKFEWNKAQNDVKKPIEFKTIKLLLFEQGIQFWAIDKFESEYLLWSGSYLKGLLEKSIYGWKD